MLWLSLLLSAAAYTLDKVQEGGAFYSDVTALLPKQKNSERISDLEKLFTNSFENKIMLLVRRGHKNSDEFAKALQLNLLKLKTVSAVEPGEWQQVHVRHFGQYSQSLLTQETRDWLSTANENELVDSLVQDLLLPTAGNRLLPFNEDPANLFSAWLSSKYSADHFQIIEGLSVAQFQNEQWFVLAFELNGNPYSVATQAGVLREITLLESVYPDIALLRSGLLFHAAHGAAVAKAEISTIGVGSLLFVVLLVVLAFRSGKPLILMLVVLASSMLGGISASLWFFDRIHLVTLALGGTLIGVAIDYLFHFLVKSHYLSSGILARSVIFKALSLSLITTLCAYVMQLQAPFPGLQQMAIFCAAGLFTAWLSVLVLAPLYKVDNNPLIAYAGCFEYPVRAVYTRLVSSKWVKLMLFFALGMIALLAVLYGKANDDISQLNTSGDELLNMEKKANSIVGGFPVGRYFLVAGATGDELITSLLALQNALDKQGVAYYNSLADYLTLSSQQQSDWKLVSERIWGEGAAYQQALQRLGISVEPEAKQFQLLGVDKFVDQSYVPQVVKSEGLYNSILYVEQLETSVAPQIAGVYYVDKVATIERVLAVYSEYFIYLLVVGLLLVSALFVLVYRSESLSMIMALFVILSFSLLCASLTGLTLFHLMALLLVVGVSIDAIVFYREMGFEFESWFAVTLSSASSVVAFGLLYLSSVPVLSQFGFVVLIGLLTCWLITPLFFVRKRLSSYE